MKKYDPIQTILTAQADTTELCDKLTTEKPCDLKVCKAECCYLPPLPAAFVDKYQKEAVRQVFGITRFIENMGRNDTLLYLFTHPTSRCQEDNPCPFLTEDLKCFHYDDRPSSCRTWGTGVALICQCGYHHGFSNHRMKLPYEFNFNDARYVDDFVKLLRVTPCDYKARYQRDEPEFVE